MYLGYNTNGFVHHRLSDTIAILSDLGYKGIAITIDHNAIDPFDSNRMANLEQLAFELEKYQMRSVIETGARYVLDPLRKHQPSLVSRDPQGRAKRLAFYEYAIDAAAILDSDCVSFWSGRLEKRCRPQRGLEPFGRRGEYYGRLCTSTRRRFGDGDRAGYVCRQKCAILSVCWAFAIGVNCN